MVPQQYKDQYLISSVFRAKKGRLSGKMGGKKNVLSKMPAGCAGPTPFPPFPHFPFAGPISPHFGIAGMPDGQELNRITHAFRPGKQDWEDRCHLFSVVFPAAF